MLRGLAALSVVFSHYIPYWERYMTNIPVVVPNYVGHEAVKLFFVISGFVIFMTLERCKTVMDFVVLRFSRLYPAYWMSLIVVTLISTFVFGRRFWAGSVVTNATMFQEFLGYPHADNVYWSLSVELAFYLNVGWLFALGLHRRINRVVFVWLVVTVLWVVLLDNPGSVDNDDTRDWLALVFALDFAPFFAMGIVFYGATQKGWTWPLVGLIAFAIAVEFLLNSWADGCVGILIAVLFWLAVSGRLRMLVGRATLWLGMISYSLYLVHRNLGYQLLRWFHEHDTGPVVAISVCLVVAVTLAAVLTYAVEKPALALLRGYYRRRRASTSAAVDPVVSRGR